MPSQPPAITGLRVGIADRYKAGLWTQVEITLRGGDEPLDGALSVIVPDGDGVPGRVSVPCQVLPGQDITARLITRFGRVDSTLTVEFRVSDRVVAEKIFTTGPRADADHFLPALEVQSLIVIVGDSALGIEDVGKLGSAELGSRPVAVRVDDLGRLPTDWCGYEGVRAVILTTTRPGIYRDPAADEQLAALDRWVRMGGRVVLCVGAKGDEVFAPSGPLRDFAPGKFEKMVTLRETGALETYTGSRMAIAGQGGGRVAMRVPLLSDVEGKIEAAEMDLPLVVRTARGFGQVLFAAVDPEAPPMANWSDRPRMIARWLDLPTDRDEQSAESAAMMHFGYNDIAGQLRSALDRFAGVRLAPFWLVAGLIIVYILLIGPGDYLFLRRLVGRMTWTWFTFPMIVVIAGVGAYMLAQWFKGDRVRVHQVDLVDVDAASNRVRGTTWMNLFSPRTESYDLSLHTMGFDGRRASDARVWMAWMGLPGRGLGGMDSRASGPALWTEQFSYASELNALEDVPVQQWSTKSLTARWSAPSDACPEAALTDADGLLSGTIVNTLPFKLENCLLAHGRSAYELGALAPGEAARVGSMSRRSQLRTLLTGRRAMFTEDDRSRQAVTPYDQSSTDLAYILRMMTFYEAAGGRRYTGLWNAYQEFVDLSNLLKTDRAVLFASGPVAAAGALLRDGRRLNDSDTEHSAFYRFIFPVTKQKSG